MSTQHSLQADLLGLLPHRPPVNTQHLTQVLPQRAQVPLVPSIITGSRILLKVCVCLVDAVVCQVDELVAELLRISCISGSGKVYNPILVNINLERINTGDENMETEVKFEAINEEWIVNVLL